MEFDKILDIAKAIGSVPGVPQGAAIGAGAQLVDSLIEAFTGETGKTKEELFAEAGVRLDAAEAKLLEDLAKGE